MHDLVVVSDLHLGRGKNPETGRFFGLETFFWDDDFRRFCAHLRKEATDRATSLRLVLNGDVFDLLRIEPVDGGGALTPATAAETVRAILGGHPSFAEGLATILASGHEVLLLPGNHDPEIQWRPVQDVVRAAILKRLRAHMGDEEADGAIRGLRFEPWFHHEPGRIWIEHGCQYDPEGAFRYPLRSGLVDQPDALHEAELDLPLGNFFQRYLYNAFGSITFIVPSTRAHFRYFKWLLFNDPRLLFRVTASHGPFMFQVLRRLAKVVGTRKDLERAHEEELGSVAERSGLGEKLRTIDSWKNVRGDVAQAGSQLLRQLVKISVAVALLAGLAASLWFAGFHAINELRAGFVPKALLFLALNFLFLVSGTVALAYALRTPPSVPPKPMRSAAQRIAQLLDVPIVTFGHTHDEAIQRMNGSSGGHAWYFNTGTWVSVFTHDVLYPRERVQLTFLRVRGHEAELLHWSPGRGEALPVILIDDDAPREARLRLAEGESSPAAR